MTEPTDEQLLDVVFHSDDLDEDVTPRIYLKRLLTTLFEEVDGFSGKRPFGNSGWWADLAPPWIKAGFLKGSLDEDGYIQDFDDDTYDQYVARCIEAL